jgi:5-oxoprolinase (ATP-hydrolysing) subunit A
VTDSAARPARAADLSCDLNCDLGEGFGRWTLADDAALLALVSSANVACGFHAGDPGTMRRVTAVAVRRGVRIGAHVSYRDLAGFGRRFVDVPPVELADDVVYQLAALDGFARLAGDRVRYVKPHGALYNAIVHHEGQAHAVVDAVRAYDPTLPVMGLPGSAVLRAAEASGLPVLREAFADRAYQPTGALVPRGEPGAVLHDPGEVAERVLRLVGEGVVRAADGTDVAVEVDSVCVHSDTPGAVGLLTAVRARLDAAGVTVRAATPVG